VDQMRKNAFAFARPNAAFDIADKLAQLS
jgi:hypothetical protein